MDRCILLQFAFAELLSNRLTTKRNRDHSLPLILCSKAIFSSVPSQCCNVLLL